MWSAPPGGSSSKKRRPGKESVIEKASHERRRTQHLIQNLVHEEYRLRVDEVRGWGRAWVVGVRGVKGCAVAFGGMDRPSRFAR